MKWILYYSIAYKWSTGEPQQLQFETYEACVAAAAELVRHLPKTNWSCVATGPVMWPRPGGKW